MLALFHEGKHPFGSFIDRDANILHNRYINFLPENCDLLLFTLLESMLGNDTKLRPNCDKINEILQNVSGLY